MRSWDGFARRLPANLNRLDKLGIRYDKAPFDPVPALTAADKDHGFWRLAIRLEAGGPSSPSVIRS